MSFFDGTPLRNLCEELIALLREWSPSAAEDKERELKSIVTPCEPYVSWTTEDVLEEADALGVQMTQEEAEGLLRKIEGDIVEVMVEAGWDVISEAIERYKAKGGEKDDGR